MATAIEYLTEAKRLIETHGWVKGFYGDEQLGFCTIGALAKSGANLGYSAAEYMKACDSVEKVIETAENRGLIIRWNDLEASGSAEVLDMFDRAMQIAGENDE